MAVIGRLETYITILALILCLQLQGLPTYGETPPAAPTPQSNQQASPKVNLPTSNQGAKESSQSGKVPQKEVKEPENGFAKDPEETLRTDLWLVLLTGALVVFTAGLVLVTGLLWKATERLAKSGEGTAERQLRAYMFASAQLLTRIESGDEPRVKVSIRNYGQTPAYNLTHIGGMGVGATFDELPTPGQPARVAKSPLGPGATITQVLTSEKNPLGEQRLSGIKHGNLALWIFGTIRYRDAFDKERFANYRFVTGGSRGLHGSELEICEEGNEAD